MKHLRHFGHFRHNRAVRVLTRLVFPAVILTAGCSSCADDFDEPDASSAQAATDAGQVVDASSDATIQNAGPQTRDVGPLDAAPDTRLQDADTPVCGDGEVQGAEACDDGNTSGDDYCAPDCSQITGRCGDGTVQTAVESCDDGNTSSDDYCAPDCSQITGRCGDGAVQTALESCDDGVTADCIATHDGGDGTCVATDTCSTGFVLSDGDCIPETVTEHVHIYVANDCSMMVDPTEYSARPGQKVRFAWHNHSQFYAVDVWQSYIGGYTDLATGDTWNERHEWCSNVNPYQGYSDITTNSACPSHRFFINCPGR